MGEADAGDVVSPQPEPMSEAERREALAFLKRPDLLDEISRDIDALGYVGEDTNKRLGYLVAVSRKLDDPLSAIVMSQSGAGKSGLTEVIEKLTPAEDMVLCSRGSRRKASTTSSPAFSIASSSSWKSVRLDRGGLLDSRSAEPEEAHRGGADQGSGDGEHAHQDFHGGSSGGIHRSHYGGLSESRERDSVLRAVDGREPGADAADPRASADDADRGRAWL